MLHGYAGQTEGVVAGPSGWGLAGNSLDGLTEFSGRVRLYLSVEVAENPVPGQSATPLLRPRIQGAPELTAAQVPADGPRPQPGPQDRHAYPNPADDPTSFAAQVQQRYLLHLGAVQVDPYDPVDSLAAPPAASREERADPIDADYKLVVPTILTEVADAAGRSVPYGRTRQAADAAGQPLTDATGQPVPVLPVAPLEWRALPAPGAPAFPRNAHLEVSADGLTAEIVRAFAGAGLNHMEPLARQQIVNHARTLGVGEGLSFQEAGLAVTVGVISGRSGLIPGGGAGYSFTLRIRTPLGFGPTYPGTSEPGSDSGSPEQLATFTPSRRRSAGS